MATAMPERISATLKASKRLRAAARRLLWQRKWPKGPAYQNWELGRSARPPLLPPPHPLFRGAAGKGKKARATQVSCRAASAMSKRPADNPLGALWQRAAPHPSPWLRRASRRPPPSSMLSVLGNETPSPAPPPAQPKACPLRIQRLDLRKLPYSLIHFRCDTPDLAVVMWHAQRRQPQCTVPFFYTKAFCGVIYYCLVFLRLSADHVLRSSAGCCLRNGAWDAAEECTAHPDKPNHPCHCGMAGR